MKWEDNFPILSSKCSVCSCFSFLFLPFFLHPSHHADYLSCLFSIGDLSSPITVLLPSLSFFSSMFSLPHHTPLSSPHFFLLYHLCSFSCFFLTLSLSLSHTHTHILTLFLSVLWKLSPLCGCHAEDLSPSAPAVPPKVM